MMASHIIGRWFYTIIQAGATGTAADNQLWRWTVPVAGSSGPVAPCGEGAGGSSTQYNAHSAGIAIGILIGIANVWLLVLIARNTGALPAWCHCCVGGARKVEGTAGFYAPAPSAVSAAMGGYVAPTDA